VLELASRGRALRTVAISPVGGATPDEARSSRRSIALDHRGSLVGARLPDVVLKALFGTGLSRRFFLRNQMTRAQDVSPERLVYAVRTMDRATSFDELLDEISGANDLIERNRERFGRISSPVLIIWGSEDRVLPATGGTRLAEAIPGAELHLMPDVGHALLLDHPEPLARLVSDYLRRS
jgi:pimeloyl-ACP methyl ester carboxylesterase